MMAVLAAIVCHSDDSVAIAVRRLCVGEYFEVLRAGRGVIVRLEESIPVGHKFALVDISAGHEIIKYGEKIGVASAAIAQGEHVHLHNLEGMRGRGDLR
jgi:altronate dehydratase small subunit